MEAAENERKDDEPLRDGEFRIGADDGRQGFGELIDRAWRGEVAVVMRNRKPRAVMLGYEQYRAILQRLEAATV